MTTATVDWIQKNNHYNWHPYTQMKDCETHPPILIERAKGLSLFDSEGKEYLDTIASWWCNTHGHNHPTIVAAIKAQLDQLDHVLFGGFTHKPAIELSEKLVEITPEGLERVFYSDNGSTAVEVGMKMAIQYWQQQDKKEKTTFISLEKGYHGDTIGTMGVSGVTLFKEVFNPILNKNWECPVPETEDDIPQALDALEDVLKKNHHTIAALIIEPLVQGVGGMRMMPESFIRELSAMAKRYECLVIADEVAVGFGRTGQMFACDKAGISPDFLCLSKGITNGMLPFAATLTTDTVYRSFYDNEKTFYHGHTYTANPIGCAAGLASLQVFEEEKVLDHVNNTLIPALSGALDALRAHPNCHHVRQCGVIAAFELKKPDGTSFPDGDKVAKACYREGLKQGIICRPLGETLYYFLPLCTTEDQINDIVNRTQTLLAKQF